MIFTFIDIERLEKMCWIIAILALFGVAMLIGDYSEENPPKPSSTSSSSEPEWTPPSEPDRTFVAKVVCQETVKENLKAPSTAEFDAGDVPQRQGDSQRYVHTSYVDAQNSFGASLRLGFTCELTCDRSNACRDIRIDFDERG